MDDRIQGNSCAGNVVVAVPLVDVLLCHAALNCTAVAWARQTVQCLVLR
jgi:hypothetical protein